jgi:hypothetical protein
MDQGGIPSDQTPGQVGVGRGPGLPSNSDDRGNWTEHLGLTSQAIEGLLVAVPIAAVSTLSLGPSAWAR